MLDYIYKKLFTKEDEKYNHIHKILGIVCLCHFLYRFILFIRYRSFMFIGGRDMIWLSFHGLLSLTSLIFHISGVRNKVAPMIYPEFRMHSIVFAFRSILCCALHHYKFHIIYSMMVIFATMGLADLITYHYKSSSNTMRNMPYDENIAIEDQNKMTRFHSRMQVCATLFMLINEDTAFSPLLSIQLAAFLMTLVRKNIIKAMDWHTIYAGLLYTNYFLYTEVKWIHFVFVISSFLFFVYLRFDHGINKYICWSLICVYKLGMMMVCNERMVENSIFYDVFIWMFILKNIYDFYVLVYPFVFHQKKLE